LKRIVTPADDSDDIMFLPVLISEKLSLSVNADFKGRMVLVPNGVLSAEEGKIRSGPWLRGSDHPDGMTVLIPGGDAALHPASRVDDEIIADDDDHAQEELVPDQFPVIYLPTPVIIHEPLLLEDS
jgi:hypothetical protein